jgi:predicted RNA-binding protein with EMAP domain
VVRDKVRNVKPFRGSRNVAEKLISDVLPKMQELNYCVIDGQTIYINPRLK